jgi:hypothetical protein
MKTLLLLFSLLFSFSVNAQVSTGNFSRTKAPVYNSTLVAFEGEGTTASGTTSCAPAYPDVDVGNGIILAIGTKTRDAKVECPAGWEVLRPTMDHVASSGADQGEIGSWLFWREATSTITTGTTVTVNCSNCNSMNAQIYVFSKDSQARWEVVTTSGSHFTPSTDTYSVTSKKFRSKKNDLLFVVSDLNTDAYAMSTQGVTQSGATFSTLNAEVGEYPTVQGNDQEQWASVFRVTSASVVNAPLVYTTTLNASGSPLGTTTFVALRQYFSKQTLPPAGFYSWSASDIVDQTYSGDGSPLWDGMRTSLEKTGTVAEQYEIVTFNGEPHFKFTTQLVNSTNYSRRSEVSNHFWPGNYPIGTQIIFEIMYKTGPTVPSVYREFDVMQNHTGTAAGGPWPLNSPLFYIAFAHAGQAGWNNGTPDGGEIGLVRTPTDPDIRLIFPGYEWEENSVYRIRYHMKVGHAADDTCMKLWLEKNGGGLTLVYEDYTYPTAFVTDDIAEHGAPADVGGATKIGIYDHMITDGTDASTAVSAGHTGYTLYSPGWKMIIQYPSYPDYITDVTDNSNPIYEYVSTE